MDGSQVGVLEEGDEVGLGGFLERHDGRGLEAEVGLREREMSTQGKVISMKAAYLEVLGDFSDKTLEGELADEKLGRLLVSPNFTQSNSTGPETMGLLDTTSCVLYNGHSERDVDYDGQ